MVKQINPDDFPPTKPEKDGIRYLRGKKALNFQNAWEATNVTLRINPIFYILLELRCIFIEYMDLEMKYFDNRHRYSPEHRRLLDLMFTYMFEQAKIDNPEMVYIFSDTFMYKYLKYKYSPENKRFYYWQRICSHADKKQVFVWHEDIDKYCKMTAASKL